MTGSEEGKPVFIFQGGNCINPVTLSWFTGFLKEYRVYAPDTIGHPGYSEERRMSANDESSSLWISDLMKFFGVEKAAFIGPSYGGGIILRLATYMPEKIACAVLVSPAGIKLGSKMKMISKILIPMLYYRQTGSWKSLEIITDNMSSGGMSEIDRDITGEIFRSVKLEQDMPKLTKRYELKEYNAPTLLIASEKDVFFPGEAVIKQARKVIPSLVRSYLAEGGHFPSDTEKIEVKKEIRGFLKEYY